MVGGEGEEGVRVIFANVQSIVKKMDEVRALMTMEEPDIFVATETWANENLNDAFFHIPGYDIIAREDRNDTEKGRGGGILVYAVKAMHIWKINLETKFNQYASVQIKTGKSEIKIHVIYRSPNSRKENDDELCAVVEKMTGNNILIGDFNYPDIDWDAGSSGARGRNFFEAATNKYMEQHVQEPTHLSGNILDLILTDQEGMITTVKTIGRVGKSDHETISFTINVTKKKEDLERRSWNFRRAKYDEMRLKMKERQWDECLADKDVNGMWISIRGFIKDCMEKYIPKRKNQRKNEPAWMNTDIRISIISKRKAWKKWKETGSWADKDAYKKKEKETKKKIMNSKKRVEKEVMTHRKTNPKLFYAFINRSKTAPNRIGPLAKTGSNMVVDPKEQAQILNQYFASVFTRSNHNLPEIEPRDKDAPTLTNIVITEEIIGKAIDQINADSSPGPDGIPSKVIKELKEELLLPLGVLFKESLKSGKIPDEWREAEVVPLFKKGKRSDPSNYRPVSLTVIICKIMERIIKAQMTTFIECNGLIENSQHGFRRGRSPQTNLIEYQNTTTKWIDEGRSFDVLYLDFAKAFDVVSHDRLLLKLKKVGVDGVLLKWLEDWLKGRRQRVRVDGEHSEWEDVLSSVVQGSVLGGLLFNIFNGDIDSIIEYLKAIMWKFADDSKIAKLIESLQDGIEMQMIIDRLVEWAEKWEMRFNVGKCKILHFGNKNPKIEYKMNGVKLESVTGERDLGIWIDTSMKPSKHCNKVANSTNFAMGQMLRSFHYRKKENLIPLYKTFFRPRLEFAAAAWSPWLEGDIQTLEKVQERLLKQIPNIRGRTYEERLKDAELTTLRERRRRGDAIETFKTMKGFNRVEKNTWFDIIDENGKSTRSTTSITANGEVEKRTGAIRIEGARLDIRKFSFTVRAAKQWNCLPEDVRRQETVNGFKSAYDRWERNKNLNER